jgi:hypothetical protein
VPSYGRHALLGSADRTDLRRCISRFGTGAATSDCRLYIVRETPVFSVPFATKKPAPAGGTESLNPASSSGESANHRFRCEGCWMTRPASVLSPKERYLLTGVRRVPVLQHRSCAGCLRPWLPKRSAGDCRCAPRGTALRRHLPARSRLGARTAKAGEAFAEPLRRYQFPKVGSAFARAPRRARLSLTEEASNFRCSAAHCDAELWPNSPGVFGECRLTAGGSDGPRTDGAAARIGTWSRWDRRSRARIANPNRRTQGDGARECPDLCVSRAVCHRFEPSAR